MPLVYFIVLVGVLVFVHELGHLVWAKYFGVRVLKVSLGFGPRIAGFRRGETEYVISALPLGGYVRMLGENPWDEVRAKDAERSFANLSVLRRFVIVVGGPAMNLLFPILLYFVVFLGDRELTPASIGMVFPDRPADGKLMAGDVVTRIDGDEVSTFYDLSRIIESNPGKPLRLSVLRGGKEVEQTVTPVSSEKERPLELNEQVGRIGVMPHHPLAVIGVMGPDTAAAAARLRTFDVIVSAAGRPVDRYIDLDKVLGNNQGSLVPVTYLRPEPVPNAMGGLIDLDVYEPRVTTLTPEPGTGSALPRSGIELSDLYVSDVTAGSPEHALGLLPGDRLIELDGRPVRLWATFLQDLKAQRGRKHWLTWRRGERQLSGQLTLTHQRGVSEQGQVYDRYVVGIRNWVPTRLDAPVPNPRPITYAVREALRATADVVQLTLFSVVRLVQGRLTMKSIGGPLTVFQVAGTAAQAGALNYLTLMAFISINLGLINLLPVPLLDGGHLMFFLVEAVARRPVSVRVREYAHMAGLVFLLGMMILAFKNDIERQWPELVHQIAGK
ncbi:MAG TPA: site-2 protease family protein [Polyangiales bacterium]